MERPFYTCLAVRIIKPMRFELCFVYLSKVFHYRCNYCVWPYTTGHDNVAIINDTFTTGSIHKGKGLGKKYFAFKPGETGIVLDIDYSAVGQNKRGALSRYFIAIKFEFMGRGIMLHLFTRLKHILTSTFFTLLVANIMLSDYPGQTLVRNHNAMAAL